MNTRYFIEILNAHGDILRREQLNTLPIHIGRSYRNDIILDDPHIASAHAVVESNEIGELIIRDLDTHNGIHQHRSRGQAFVIDGDKVFRLGKTHLRIRTDDYPVENEQFYSVHNHRGYWPQAIVALVVICLFTLLGTWLTDIEKGNSSTYVTALLALVGMVIGWAGIFALANRVFGGAANFSRHLLILCSCIVVVEVTDYLSAFLAFALSWEFVTRYGTHLQIILLAGMMYFHLQQISPRRPTILKWMCAGIAVIGSGVVLQMNYQSTNQFADELYSHEILLPSMRISRDHSVEEFVSEVGELKNRIDKERKDLLAEKQTAH